MNTYEHKKTHNKDLFRVVDRDGNWTHYFHAPSKKYLRAVNYILDIGYAKGIYFHRWLLSKSSDEAEKILKYAGDRGDRVHKAIAFLLEKGKIGRWERVYDDEKKTDVPLENGDWDCMLAFQSFWNRHEPILISKEESVYDVDHGYAGTFDAVIKLTKSCEVRSCRCNEFVGKVGLYDWKSSGGIYPNHGAQVAAYNFAGGAGRAEYTAILRVGTNHKLTGGYEFQPYDVNQTATHFMEFLAAKQIADAEYHPFDPGVEIYDVPDIVEIIEKKEEIKVEPKESEPKETPIEKSKKARKPRKVAKKKKKTQRA